jgi:hypothetical protein
MEGQNSDIRWTPKVAGQTSKSFCSKVDYSFQSRGRQEVWQSMRQPVHKGFVDVSKLRANIQEPEIWGCDVLYNPWLALNPGVEYWVSDLDSFHFWSRRWSVKGILSCSILKLVLGADENCGPPVYSLKARHVCCIQCGWTPSSWGGVESWSCDHVRGCVVPCRSPVGWGWDKIR